MSRALTIAELALLRTRPLRSELYLVAQKSRTVWTSTVLVAPPNDDRAVQFTSVDNATADMLSGMTMRVTDAGTGAVKGFVRLRDLTPGSPILDIGETSEIAWANGDIITVLDEFSIWPRHIRIVDEANVYIDEEGYVAQHTTCQPVPVFGPNGVPRLAAGSVTMGFDASDSWEPNGGALTYLWTVTPAAGATISDDDIANPTITFTHAVSHRVTLAVSCGGVTSYGYRYIFVLPETGWTSEDGSYTTTPRMALTDCSGNYDQGGWQFGVTLYDDADMTAIRDRALCVLCSDDYHGNTLTAENIGLYTGVLGAGRNNILCVGWVKGLTIDVNPDKGAVTFQVGGPQTWLDLETNFPLGLFDSQYPDLPATTSGWSQFADLTVDKALWHLGYWRSTITLVTDFYVTGDTRQIGVSEGPVGMMLRQVSSLSDDTILAHPACDKLGRLFVRINPQCTASPRTFPDVFENSLAPLGIHPADRRGTMNIEQRDTSEAGQVDISGISYLNGVAAPFFSLSPGHIPMHYGAMERRDRFLFADQAAANQACGLMGGMLNNEYPTISIPLAAMQKLVDIAPEQYVSMVIAAGDTERGIVWPDDNDIAAGLAKKRLLPRRITFSWDSASGVLLPDLECEAESWEQLAVTGDSPPTPPEPPAPPEPPPPPVPPVAYSLATEIIFMVGGDKIYWSDDVFDLEELTPHYLEINGPIAAGMAGVAGWFDAMPDGSAIYVSNLVAGTVCNELWRATNFRTSPAAPNWTKVLAQGDVVGGQTLGDDFRWRCAMYGGASVICFQSWCVPGAGAWNLMYGLGPAWVWTLSVGGAGGTMQPFPLYNSNRGGFFAALSLIGINAVFDGQTNVNDNFNAWANDAGQIYRFAENVGTHYVRDAIGHADCLTLAPANVPGTAHLQGSWMGNQMTFVDAAGNAMAGDGCAIAPTGLAWGAGVLWPVLISGGNFLVWQRDVTPAMEDIVRISLDGFTSDYLQRNGNFWAIAGVGIKTLINMCIMAFEA